MSINNLKVQNKCLTCEMRSENYFCNLSEANLKIFESLKITKSYPIGAVLFMQGENSRGVYMLCSGRIKLLICSEDGKAIILHIAKAGEVLGLSEAISHSTYIATAEVLESCQVNFVRNEDFLFFLSQNAEASVNAIRQLSQKYQTACSQIGAMGLSPSVAAKLATLFLGWCNAGCEQSDGSHLRFSYTHEELAQMIGTSRETVSRVLKIFNDRKLISRKGSELIIHNKEKLAAIGKLKSPNLSSKSHS